MSHDLPDTRIIIVAIVIIRMFIGIIMIGADPGPSPQGHTTPAACVTFTSCHIALAPLTAVIKRFFTVTITPLHRGHTHTA